MAWPDVLRWLALIVGGAASLMGLVWTLRCIFRPWMREAAREAADGLYEAAPGQRLPAAMKGLGATRASPTRSAATPRVTGTEPGEGADPQVAPSRRSATASPCGSRDRPRGSRWRAEWPRSARRAVLAVPLLGLSPTLL